MPHFPHSTSQSCPPNLRSAPAAADGSATGVNATTRGSRQPAGTTDLSPGLLPKAGPGWRGGDARTPDRNKMGGRGGVVWGGGLYEAPWAESSACSRLAKHSARTWARAHRPPPSLLRLVRAAAFRESPRSSWPRLPPRAEVHICLVVPLTSLGPFFLFPSLFLLL